jgi:hypothetical protein
MIGDQPEGTISGVVISAVSYETMKVTVDGKPARLAVIDDDGNVVAAGPQVAKEVQSVVINCYRNFWKGKGFLRVNSVVPVDRPTAPAERGKA